MSILANPLSIKPAIPPQEVVKVSDANGKVNYKPVIIEADEQPDDTYSIVHTCTVEREFYQTSKGIESLARPLMPNGTSLMLGLCEGNFCEGGWCCPYSPGLMLQDWSEHSGHWI